MKKLVFLFAMVFAVSMAMGQKTTWVDQSGNGNVADITQSACMSNDATSIYAVQSGDWNSLTTMQTGNDNYLELIQSGNNNSADMEQFTCDADDGGDNVADVYQSGVSNSATLVQEEDNLSGQDYSDNVANAFQSGNNNSFTLDQGSAKYRPNSWSYLTQSGDGNDAVIDQIGQTQYSEIVQSGDWNTADLDQTGQSGMGSSWDESYSWQRGANNVLDINQNGNPGFELVESVQNGNSNTTNVIQNSRALQEVNSKQKGTNDIINVTQID